MTYKQARERALRRRRQEGPLKYFQIWGIRQDGSAAYIFTWIRSPEAGIARAEREAADFNEKFERFEAREII